MLDVPTARSLLRATRPRRHADGYPAEVRAGVAALARTRLAEGLTCHAVAGELGIHGNTLQRWLDSTPRRAPCFLPVVLDAPVGSTPQATVEATTPDRPASSVPLTLVSPSGFRLDGLSLDDAITALLRLS